MLYRDESIKYMEEVPESMLPSIEIEYVYTIGMSVGGGDIENVPENAIGAIITQRYPYVDKMGEIALSFIEYGIYVGKTMAISEALLKVADVESGLMLEALYSDGYDEVVVSMDANESIEDFVGFDSDVSLVSSHEELVDRINEINLLYKAMNPTFSYPEMSFKGRSRKRTTNN